MFKRMRKNVGIILLLASVCQNAWCSESEENPQFALAKVDYLGYLSNPGCIIIDGCKTHQYELVKVISICGTEIEEGMIIKARFPIGTWETIGIPDCGDYPRGNGPINCQNNPPKIFKHASESIVEIIGSNYLSASSISRVLNSECGN